jgi:hypothetical protein
VPGSRLRVWDGRVTSQAQGADPPVHAARAQGVPQLNGAEVLLALRTCRIECVACTHTYTPTRMIARRTVGLAEVSPDCGAAFSCIVEEASLPTI